MTFLDEEINLIFKKIKDLRQLCLKYPPFTQFIWNKNKCASNKKDL